MSGIEYQVIKGGHADHRYRAVSRQESVEDDGAAEVDAVAGAEPAPRGKPEDIEALQQLKALSKSAYAMLDRAMAGDAQGAPLKSNIKVSPAPPGLVNDAVLLYGDALALCTRAASMTLPTGAAELARARAVLDKLAHTTTLILERRQLLRSGNTRQCMHRPPQDPSCWRRACGWRRRTSAAHRRCDVNITTSTTTTH